MKEILRDNDHLVILPVLINPEDWIIPPKMDDRLESIKEGILRHVDNITQIHIKYDTIEVCSYCKSPWEVVEELEEWGDVKGIQLGMPVCCEKAQTEWKQESKSTMEEKLDN